MSAFCQALSKQARFGSDNAKSILMSDICPWKEPGVLFEFVRQRGAHLRSRRACVFALETDVFALETGLFALQIKPLHDIAITNFVWCMVQNRGVRGGGSYIAQWTCNSIAIVRVMQVGGANKRMID